MDELLGFRNGRGEWLVDDDVAPGQQALLRDRMMRRIGCGDDDQVDGPREQLVDATKEFDIRIARVRRAPPTALDDGGEAETFHGANHGCVEYLACKAEPDESDGEHDR